MFLLKENKREDGLFLLFVVLSAGLFLVAGVNDYVCKQQNLAALKKYEIADSPNQVIGLHPTFQGDPHSPYTLVEFGDYECPPCRAENVLIPGVLSKFRGRLRFTFRNLPLTQIHPAAMPAAIAAEAARRQGKFWPMHDLLYADANAALSVATVKAAIYTLPLNRIQFDIDSRTTAKQEVAADLMEAHSLGLNGTPSFLLCCPDHHVLHLESLSQVASAM